MSVTAKALREARAKLVHQARTEILEKAEAENRNLTAEEQASWDKIMGGTAPDGTEVKGEVDLLMERIKRVEDSDAKLASLAAPANDTAALIQGADIMKAGTDGGSAKATSEQRALAIQGWMLGKRALRSERHVDALRATGISPWDEELCLGVPDTERLREMQAAFRRGHVSMGGDRVRQFGASGMSTISGASGGYLIPPETLTTELEVNMLAYGGMRQVAQIISTAHGERMSWPTGDDTANKGILLGQNQTAPTTGSNPTFAKVYWDAYKFSSNSPDGTPILVAYELLQDSVINLVRVLGEMLGARLGRISNDYYTTGTGTAQPKGVVTAATTFAAASSTAIAFDDIFGLIHAIDPAYRTADCGFMCHDNIVLAIRKLKDGIGRYLWEPGLQVGAPDRILSYEWTVNQSMDSATSSGKNTLLFGRLGNYKIRRVAGGLDGGIRLYRLHERYRDADQDGFMAFMREDGNLLTAGTAPVKVLHHT